MSSRICAFTVALKQDVHEETATRLREAIEMLQGVLSVTEHEADVHLYIAQERARSELSHAIWDVLHPKTKES